MSWWRTAPPTTRWSSGTSPSISMSRARPCAASLACCVPEGSCSSPCPTSPPRRRGSDAPAGSTSTCRGTSCTSRRRRCGRSSSSAGFRPVKVTHLVPEYDLFSFVQTAENRLGLPPNLLYDVLRRPEARLRRQQSSRLLAGVAVGLAVPLSIAAAVIAPLAAARGAARPSPCMRCGVPDQRE